ncbi:MAG: hypothetical protein AAGB51_08365 [Planctomycetota bacterium]
MKPKNRAAKIAVQLVGFLIAIALFGWAVSMGFSEENRGGLERLRDAGPLPIAQLIGLSLVVVATNGFVFWLTMIPVRRLRLRDIQAANGLCTLLAFLPFKLGAITRVAIHRQRDGVPVMLVGAWWAAILVVFAGGVAPVLLATIVADSMGLMWWATVAASMVATTLIIWRLSGVFEGPKGMARLRALMLAERFSLIGKLLHSDAAHHLHSAFRMTDHLKVVTGCHVLRLVDIGAQAGRIAIAAGVVGLTISPHEAVALALGSVLIMMASPVGLVGTREAGVVALAAWMGLTDGIGEETSDQLALALLVVTGSDLIAVLVAAGVGVGWLGPHRLFEKGAGSPPPAPTMRSDEDRPMPDQPDDR